MGFLLNGKPLQEGVQFKDAKGTTYPANWLNQSTEEEKAAIGVVWVADPVKLDDRFYWNGNPTSPKALEDKEETDSEGTKSVTKGLKSNFIAQVKDTAGKLLAQTDWTIIRKAERGIDVPATIADKRAHIISEANRLETAITATTTVEELIAVLNNQNWGE